MEFGAVNVSAVAAAASPVKAKERRDR